MAGRAVWKGAIGLGGASIAVRLYVAASEQGVDLHMVHVHKRGAPSRVRQRLVCESEDVEIERAATARAYTRPGGEVVVLTDEDLAGVRSSSERMEIQAFAPATEIAPTFVAAVYSLSPDDTGRRGFALLHRVLSERGLVAVGTIAVGPRERPCVLRPMDGALLLQTLYFADEVRVAPGMPAPDVELSADELAMGGELVDLMLRRFSLEHFEDRYRAGLLELVAAKAAGRTVSAAAAPEPPKPIDLMSALKAAVKERSAEAPTRRGRKSPAKSAGKVA